MKENIEEAPDERIRIKYKADTGSLKMKILGLFCWSDVL